MSPEFPTIPSPPPEVVSSTPPKSGNVDARFGKFRVTFPAAVLIAIISAVGTGLAVSKTDSKLDRDAEVKQRVEESLARVEAANRLKLLETRMNALEDQCHNALLFSPKPKPSE